MPWATKSDAGGGGGGYFVCMALLGMCHSSDPHFPPQISVAEHIIHRRPRPARVPARRPSMGNACTFSQYLVPETPLISTKSVPECPIVVPKTPIFTLELVPEPPMFDLAAAHTYQNVGWMPPPPPRDATLCFPLQFRTPSTFYPSDFNYFIIWVSPLTE